MSVDKKSQFNIFLISMYVLSLWWVSGCVLYEYVAILRHVAMWQQHSDSLIWPIHCTLHPD